MWAKVGCCPKWQETGCVKCGAGAGAGETEHLLLEGRYESVQAALQEAKREAHALAEQVNCLQQEASSNSGVRSELESRHEHSLRVPSTPRTLPLNSRPLLGTGQAYFQFLPYSCIYIRCSRRAVSGVPWKSP